MRFRELQTNTQGTLYLHSMPGRYEAISAFITRIELFEITHMVCLTSNDEVARKSPEYLQAISLNCIPIERTVFVVPDFGIPKHVDVFYALVRDTAQKLKEGKNVLVHCAGGIGRTGTFAGCILTALGLPMTALMYSGSFPETEEQLALMGNMDEKEK